MSEIDWARYTGLTGKTGAKRTAAELVAAAEARELRAMLGQPPEPIYVGIDRGATEFDAVSLNDAWEDMKRLIHENAVREKDARPSNAAPMAPPAPTAVVAPSLPNLVEGMRVRLLDPSDTRHGAEGTVSVIGSLLPLFLVKFDSGDARIENEEWCRTVFPVDASFLPPKVGMAVNYDWLGKFYQCTILSSSHDGRQDHWRTASGFGFRNEQWLQYAWPRDLRAAP